MWLLKLQKTVICQSGFNNTGYIYISYYCNSTNTNNVYRQKSTRNDNVKLFLSNYVLEPKSVNH